MDSYSDASEPSSMPEASGAEGPVVTYDGEVSTATLSYETSVSAVSAMGYFVICWGILLIMIVIVAYMLIEHRCRKNQIHRQEQQQQQTNPASLDVEVAEPVVEPNVSKSRKIRKVIGRTILILANLIGLVLSVLSFTSCDFVSLENEVTLNAFNADQTSITLYSLGMWKVDLTSNSNVSGCVKASNFLFFDTAYSVARFSSIVAFLFGVDGLVVFVCLIMKPTIFGPSYATKVRNLLLYFYTFALIFQLKTLILLGSSYCNWFWAEGLANICTPSIGAVASISAAFYWMLEVIAAVCLLPLIEM